MASLLLLAQDAPPAGGALSASGSSATSSSATLSASAAISAQATSTASVTASLATSAGTPLSASGQSGSSATAIMSATAPLSASGQSGSSASASFGTRAQVNIAASASSSSSASAGLTPSSPSDLATSIVLYLGSTTGYAGQEVGLFVALVGGTSLDTTLEYSIGGLPGSPIVGNIPSGVGLGVSSFEVPGPGVYTPTLSILAGGNTGMTTQVLETPFSGLALPQPPTVEQIVGGVEAMLPSATIGSVASMPATATGQVVAGSTGTQVVVSGLPPNRSYAGQHLHHYASGESRTIAGQTYQPPDYTFSFTGTAGTEAGPFSSVQPGDAVSPVP